ncbi:MAG TPA: ATP-dependent DNA helicase [Acidimicrobiales bacterium]|nr:ATP-dependent DNA helicase [Acidimicrobiales bacterium]
MTDPVTQVEPAPTSDPVTEALDRAAAALPGGGEHRAGQAEMARSVGRAIASRRHLVVQAGTGTGKSLAYLIPSMLAGERVVVATATKALQDQLAGKDLPSVATLATGEFSFAVLKGRSNYLCKQRAAELGGAGEQLSMEDGRTSQAPRTATGRPDDGRLGDQVRRLLDWGQDSPTGDRAELDFEPAPRAWAMVSTTARECPGAFRCPSGRDCFAESARQRAAESDVVVVNTHLYGAHLASGGVVLPPHDVVVFDEAHEVEEVMTDSLGIEIGPGRFRALAASARGLVDDRSDPTVDAVAEVGDVLHRVLQPLAGSRVARAVLTGPGGAGGLTGPGEAGGDTGPGGAGAVRPAGTSEVGEEEPPGLEEPESPPTDLEPQGLDLGLPPLDPDAGPTTARKRRSRTAAVSSAAVSSAAVSKAATSHAGPADAIGAGDAATGRFGVRAAAPADPALGALVELAIGRVSRLVDGLRRAERETGESDGNEIRSRRDRALLAAGHLNDDLVKLTALTDDQVAWVDGGSRFPTLRVSPIEVGPLLAERLWAEVTGVLTSATVPVGLQDRLGLPASRTDELDVGSPFDYPSHAVLYVARSLPDRRRPESEPAIHDELAALMTAAGGRTLALFTSWRAMTAAVAVLRERVDFPILAQSDLPKPALIEAFQSDEATCLFATLGFWQGVDIPGSTLSVVAIDRIPFPRPDDPVLQARRDRAGAAAFQAVDLPRAGTLLAQGAGRLIRSADDRGVVAVLDNRLASASYRGVLLARVPPMHRVVERQVVEEFLRREVVRPA